MTLCRCGHGRGWHKTSQNATRQRRRRGLRPTGHLPCTFILFPWSEYHGKTCGCRDWHPEETAK